ncbi:MAG: oligosaccharide flippase family protein [Chloroflexota bacterium]
MPDPLTLERAGADIDALGIRAIVQLLARTVATRAISLIGTIALARLLTPDVFGVFAVVTVIVTFISVIGDFGISVALVQQDHEPTDLELSTAIVAQVAIWSVTFVIIWFAAGAIPSIRPDLPPEAPAVARLMAVGLILAGLRAVPAMMLTRVLRFGPLAAIEVGQQVVYFGLAVVLASAGYGVWSFAIAVVAQGAFATVVVNAVWHRWVGLRFDRSAARRLWGFGLGFQGAQALTWARDAVVPLFGGIAGGLTAVGYMSFAWRNGQLVGAVDQIVQRVAFPAYSRLQREPERQAEVASRGIEAVTFPVAVVQVWIVATATSLVPVIFSDRWSPAAVALQLVCLGSLAGPPTSILRSLIYARGGARQAMVLAAAMLLVLLVSFPVLAATFGIAGAGLAFLATNYIGLTIHAWATRTIVPFPWLRVARILAGVGAAGTVAWAASVAIPGFPGLIVSGVAYLAILAMLALRFERSEVDRMLGLLRRGVPGPSRV